MTFSIVLFKFKGDRCNFHLACLKQFLNIVSGVFVYN